MQEYGRDVPVVGAAGAGHETCHRHHEMQETHGRSCYDTFVYIYTNEIATFSFRTNGWVANPNKPIELRWTQTFGFYSRLQVTGAISTA